MGMTPSASAIAATGKTRATGARHTLLLLANLTAAPLPMPHFDKVEGEHEHC